MKQKTGHFPPRFDASWRSIPVCRAKGRSRLAGLAVALMATFAPLAQAQSPEMAVIGNGVEIPSGDVTPTATDHTDFGNVNEATGALTRTFTISNTGADPLTLSGTPLVALSGSADFTVTQVPTSPVAATSGTTTFQITFNPTGYGPKTATVSIANDDADEAPYTFAIQGTGAATLAGEIWHPRLITSARTWATVTTSSDGGKLFAFAGNVKPHLSDNGGATWTTPVTTPAPAAPAASALTLNWKSVASSSDGTKLVAAVNNGQIYTSTDSGATWIPRDSSRAWVSVASSADGSFLVAAVKSGFIYTSSDSGVNWVAQTDSGSRSWNSVACSADGSKIVAAVYVGNVYISTNYGVNWSARSPSGSQTTKWWAVTSSGDGTTLAAVFFGGGIYVSKDSGTTWTQRAVSKPWVGISSSESGEVLAAVDNTSDLQVSRDGGVTWAVAGPSRNWASVAVSRDGTSMVAGATDYIYTSRSIVQPAEIEVSGNSVEIVNGDSTPSAADHTDFGGVNASSGSVQRTFTITNSGPGDLNLTGTEPNYVRITSGDTSSFTITSQPARRVSASGGSTSFVITFDPLSVGVKTATFSIANEDIDEGPYTFTVEGIGQQSPVPTIDPTFTVGAVSATGTGTVIPNGLESTVQFECSESKSMTNPIRSTPQIVPAGFTAQPVTGQMVGLKVNTRYYVRIVATNSIGSNNSARLEFTTTHLTVPNQPISPAQGVPGGGLLGSSRGGIINNSRQILFRGYGIVGGGAVKKWLMTTASDDLKVVMLQDTEVSPGQKVSGDFTHMLLTESGRIFTLDRILGASASEDYGYFESVGGGTGLDLVSREGDSAPDGGVFFKHTSKPVTDSLNRIYFQGDLTGVAATKNTGIWYDDGSVLSLLVKEGMDVGVAMGEPAWLGDISETLAGGGEGCAFMAALQHNPDDPRQTTNPNQASALFSSKPGELSVLARRGDSVSGIANVQINTFFGVARSSIESHAYLVSLSGTSVTKSNDSVLLSQIGGQTNVVAREGTTVIQGQTVKSIGNFYVTARSEVVFKAQLNGVSEAVDGLLCRWTKAGGIVVLAREGSAAAGTGVSYSYLDTWSVSDGGAIALVATLSDGSTGLMRAKVGDGQLSQVSRAGPGRTISIGGVNHAVNLFNIYAEGTSPGGGGGGMGAAINDAGDILAVLVLQTGWMSTVFHGN